MRGLFLSVLALVAVGGLIVVVVATTAMTNTQTLVAGQYRLSSCNAAIGPWTGELAANGESAQTQAKSLDSGQLSIAQQIIAIGKQRNLPPLAWQVSLQAGMTESTLHNYDHGDADSLGIFQMRPSMGWGTPSQLQDIGYEINKFYTVLIGIPSWDQLRPGDAAQAVERSAFPDRYHRWEGMAAWLIKNIGDVSDASGCGQSSGAFLPANTTVAGKAIAYAKQQLGKPYIWGGNGPTGYDCSGLVQEAYRSTGIVLPRVADQQYHAGAPLAVRDAQPGDLIFLATDISNPATIHHVMMYLGNNQVIEAQDFGIPIHIRSFSFKEAEVVPQAVRPGV